VTNSKLVGGETDVNAQPHVAWYDADALMRKIRGQVMPAKTIPIKLKACRYMKTFPKS